ncbi:ExbD/TolR family protein [Roseibium limicola]|uniref:Biopolymer transporter ExbD n=1 Tax=Roseibium limicola TaxID=2816037 RepID=A0A939J8S4_9HYPH|nr:biopolymer transporter ExbD [Roseibium limicola]MBO0345606.1 biopolymer transporter ExbD [Roseibium limicola]
MRFKPRVKRKAVGLTSLIDVIFLLLLFFMLASSFTRYQSLPLASGAQGGGAEVRPAYFRIHTADKMDLNGRPLSREEMPARFADVAAAEGKLVAIWSGPEATVQNVVDVMSAARRSGLDAVIVTGK